MIALGVACFACFLIGWKLAVPLSRKPLSEDDGRWHYYAMFRDRGVVLGRDFVVCGYFNVQWFSALAYRVFRGDGPEFFGRMKAVWYGLNAASMCFAAYAMYSGSIPGVPGSGYEGFLPVGVWRGVVAGVLMACVQAVPSTLFMLTYAEHYSILPSSLAIGCLLLGGRLGDPVLILVAGVMAGLVMQFKPTGVLFGLFLPLLLLGFPDAPDFSLFLYAGGFVAVQVVPILLLSMRGISSSLYLKETFVSPFRDGFAAAFSVLGIKLKQSKMSDYVKTRHSDTSLSGWQKLRANCVPMLKDLWPILLCIMAFFGVGIYMGGAIDPASPVSGMIGLFVVYIAAQQLQKNYYTPHFNTVWQPLILLAVPGIALLFVAAGMLFPLIGILAALGIVILLFSPMWRAIGSDSSPETENSFGILHPYIGGLFDTARQTGEVIKENSEPDDRLCVWGDQPSVYLYADRQAFNPHYLFLYSHHQQLYQPVWVLEALRKTPPKFFVFFNWRYKDQWDMNGISGAIGIAYEEEAVFIPQDGDDNPMVAPHGKVESFPLYRRNDASYIRALFERAAVAPVEEARAELRKILELDPENREAALRLDILGSEDQSPRTAMKLAAAAMRGKNKVAAMLVLGEALENFGDHARAVDTLENTHALAQNNPRVKAALARVLFASGQKGKAVELVQQALQLDTHCNEARYILALAMAEEGNVEGAMNLLHHVVLWNWRHRAAAEALDRLSGGMDKRMQAYDEAGVFGYYVPEALAQECGCPGNEEFIRVAYEHRSNI